MEKTNKNWKKLIKSLKETQANQEKDNQTGEGNS